MKFLKLDLLRFGPFTDVSLPLDDGHVGLHIVFGPNEAGKSSALRALKQLLFGIPHNSSDNFIHANPNLRIGALLETADGQRIECIRRKGRTQTLRTADDVEAVDPAKLIEALGSIDEATFSQRFGIDYRELVRGGRSIAQGGGDLGEILFAAGTGVADVRHVQSQIESEVQELFKPGGSNPRINDALKRLKNAYDAIKRAQLPTSTWIEHDERLKLAAQRQTHIDQQLLEMRSQESRLGRVNEALPLIGSRDRLQKQLAEVAEAPLLPDNFSVERGERTTQLKNAELAERNASNASEKLAAAIAELTAPKGLLEHRTAITRLHTDLGSYQKAAKDRPTLVAQLAQAEQQANTILCDLGRGLDIARAEELRLSRAQRQHIQSLAGDYKARLDKRRSTELAVSRLGDQIDGAVSQMAAIPPTKDLGEIKRAIRSAQKQGNLDQLLAEARSGLRQLEKQAEIELNKMRLWSGTLEQVERLPVPFLETIERFENEFADAAAAIKRIEDRINELRQQAQKVDQNLEKLRLAHDVPTEDDLAVARQKREFGWQLVRQVWQDGLPIEHQSIFAFIDEISPGTDLAHSFQTSVEAADGLADRLRREADHVAAKAKLTSDRQDLDRQLAEQAKQLVLAEKVGEGLQTKWRDQWTDLNVDPLSPREMRSWHNQQEKLAAIAETIRREAISPMRPRRAFACCVRI